MTVGGGTVATPVGCAVEGSYLADDVAGDESEERLAAGYALTDLCGADGIEAGVDKCDTRIAAVAGSGQHGGVDGVSLPGIDSYGIMAEDVLIVSPAVEGEPVVGSDDEGELLVGMLLGERLEGLPGVRRLEHPELVVAGMDMRFVAQGFACERQPLAVRQEVGGLGLEGVQGGHHEPYLIEVELPPHFFGQCDMSEVYGIEGASEDTDGGGRRAVPNRSAEFEFVESTFFERAKKVAKKLAATRGADTPECSDVAPTRSRKLPADFASRSVRGRSRTSCAAQISRRANQFRRCIDNQAKCAARSAGVAISVIRTPKFSSMTTTSPFAR